MTPDYDRLVVLCRREGITWSLHHSGEPRFDGASINAIRITPFGTEFVAETVMPPVHYSNADDAITGLFDRILSWLPLNPRPTQLAPRPDPED